VEQILLVPSTHATSSGYTDHPQRNELLQKKLFNFVTRNADIPRGKPNDPAWQNQQQQQQDGGDGGGGAAVAVAAGDIVKHISILFMEHHSTQTQTV